MLRSVTSLCAALLITGTVAAQTRDARQPAFKMRIDTSKTIDYLAEFRKNAFFQGVPRPLTLANSSSVVTGAAEWLQAQQFASGAFPWTAGESAYEEDTQGTTARSLLTSYKFTNNSSYLQAAIKTGDFLVPNYTQLFSDGDPNIAAMDPLFLEELSAVTGDAKYADFVQANLWDKLAAGTYGEANNLDAAGFADTIIGFDEFQHWIALRPFFSAHLAVAAHRSGEMATRDAFMADVREKLDSTTSTYISGDLTGLAAAIWASAITGINLDPVEGKWAASNSTADLVNRLIGYQRAAGDWPYDTGTRAASHVGDVSVTTWALMALDEWDSLAYAGNISKGLDFIIAQQQADGQILTNPGYAPDTVTGVEVHAEALTAIILTGNGGNNGNINLARFKTATASSSNASYPPADAVDGDLDSYWRSGSVSSSNPVAWLRVDLGATSTVGRAIVHWRSSYYARSYELQVSQDGSNWSTSYSTTAGAGGSQEFYFAQTPARYVRLYMTQNNSSTYRINEFEIFGGMAGEIPAAPANLVASAAGSASINLNWADEASDEDGFKIERRTGGGAYSQIATTGPNVVSFSDNGLLAGTTYTYRVQAYNLFGHSSYSNEAAATTENAPPAVPGNLAATAASSTAINLSWNDAANNEQGFKVERKTGAESFTEIAVLAANATAYSDNGLSASTAYTYRVRAYNEAGHSNYSNEATATTFGSGGDPSVNLARSKPATASSTSSPNTASRAVDGSTSTYWRSGDLSSSNQIAWLRVDLGTAQTVGRAIVRWRENYFARNYQLQVSNDNVNWSTVYSTTAGAAGNQEFIFTQTSARYVRLYLTVRNKSNYRVSEFELYSGALAKAPAWTEQSAAPEALTLERAYPNPFNPATTLSFALPHAGRVTLKVFDLAGREVATVLDEHRPAGRHQIAWNAQALSSGTYFAVLQTGTARQVQRLLLMK